MSWENSSRSAAPCVCVCVHGVLGALYEAVGLGFVVARCLAAGFTASS
ncbi:hypothetical protein ACH47C_28010 [Streptomyces rishiriensis]